MWIGVQKSLFQTDKPVRIRLFANTLSLGLRWLFYRLNQNRFPSIIINRITSLLSFPKFANSYLIFSHDLEKEKNHAHMLDL
jgi:hypothetical protein